MLLTTSYAFKEPTTEGDREAHYELHPAILRVNRRIYYETSAILRGGNMWIYLCMAMPKEPICYINETAQLPVVSRSVHNEEVKEIKDEYICKEARALDVILYPEHNSQNNNYDHHIMIMGPESMPYFLQLMFAMVYIHRSVQTLPRTKMEMHVGTPFCFTRSRLQQEILEPFSAVRGIQTITIKGNVDGNFARSLMAKMGSQWECTTEILDLSEKFLKRGDAAAAAGFTKAASFHYEQGSSFTFFAGQSYIDNFDVEADHVYNSISIASMLTTFDVRWAKVLLKLRCYKDIQCLTASMFDRTGRLQANVTEKIQLMMCNALAYLGLGKSTRFGDVLRPPLRSILEYEVSPAGPHTWHISDVFPSEHCMARNKKAMIEDLDDLAAYCKDGEEGRFRRIDTDGILPDREEIEFPTSQEWSATATRYERRRETWARNKSLYFPQY